MRPFQAALDTCLDSPFSASLSVHGLHFMVCAPSGNSLRESFGPVCLLPTHSFRKAEASMYVKSSCPYNCLSAILGPEMAAPILRAPRKNAFFLQEKPIIIQGGGSADFIFMGARIFLIDVCRVLRGEEGCGCKEI